MGKQVTAAPAVKVLPNQVYASAITTSGLRWLQCVLEVNSALALRMSERAILNAPSSSVSVVIGQGFTGVPEPLFGWFIRRIGFNALG